MMPRESWVAKWNEIRTCIPGVYAINVTQMNEYDDLEPDVFTRGKRGGKNYKSNNEFEDEDDMGDFIVKDDEAYAER